VYPKLKFTSASRASAAFSVARASSAFEIASSASFCPIARRSASGFRRATSRSAW
jgi:hypothetical protein